jgi:hypothetical protein
MGLRLAPTHQILAAEIGNVEMSGCPIEKVGQVTTIALRGLFRTHRLSVRRHKCGKGQGGRAAELCRALAFWYDVIDVPLGWVTRS